MAPKLYLIHASPPCRAVLMVAKALGLELEIEEVSRERLKDPEMIELNPQHTVPILVDSDQDFTIWDSHAIAGYLVGQYGENDSMYPKDDIKKRALIDQRLHFENGVLFERSKACFIPLLMGETSINSEHKEKLEEAFGFMEEFLKDREWIAGDDVTIADLSILATVATLACFMEVHDDEKYPRMSAWYRRAKELPYFEECNRQGLDAFTEMVGQAALKNNSEEEI